MRLRTSSSQASRVLSGSLVEASPPADTGGVAPKAPPRFVRSLEATLTDQVISSREGREVVEANFLTLVDLKGRESSGCREVLALNLMSPSDEILF